MNVLWVCGVALIAVIGGFLLRRYSSEFSELLPIVSTVFLLIAVFPTVSDILSAVRDLGAKGGLEDGSLDTVLRGIGIGIVTRFSSGVCYDCGRKGLGDTVEYCGKIAIVSLCVPQILSLAQSFSDMDF